MPVVEVDRHGVEDARVNPFRGEHRQAKAGGEVVRNLEIDLVIIVAEQERVGGQGIDRSRAEAFIKAGGQLKRQLVLTQEIHQLAQLGLFLELPPDFTRLFGGNAADFGQALRLIGEHAEGILPEGFGDARGEPGADALEQAGPQIVGNPLDIRRQAALEAVRRKLVAVGRMADPFAAEGQLLAQADAGQAAGRGDFLAVRRGQPQNGIAVFGITKDNLRNGAADKRLLVVGF